MNEADLNPYAPPVAVPESRPTTDSVETLLASGPIRFRGQATTADLQWFLRSHDHVGCVSMLITMTFASFVFGATAMSAGGAMVYLAIGAVGLLSMVMVVSLVPYRRAVFVAANPLWNAAVRGELQQDGLLIHRNEATTFLRWKWFDRVLSGENCVALLPSLSEHQPILLSDDMMSQADDWDRLVGLMAKVGVGADGSSTGESRRREHRFLLRDRHRHRTVDVPDSAIAFEGTITSGDLTRNSSSLRPRFRPLRVYVVVIGFAIFGGLSLVGIARFIGADSLVLPILIGLYLVALLTRILQVKIRAIRGGGEALFHMTAFASESGITMDFDVAVTVVPWRLMQLTDRSDESLALSRCDIRQLIVARRNMFDDLQKWNAFLRLVDRKLLEPCDEQAT